MFVIPFVFAFNPEILLIPAAVLNPEAANGGTQYLAGYDGTVHVAGLIWILARLGLSLYLLSSALAAFDRFPLSLVEVILRILMAVLVFSGDVIIQLPAIGFGLLMLLHHRVVVGRLYSG
jgi:TRAP-type uncharacterized transport system fused permease subunit